MSPQELYEMRNCGCVCVCVCDNKRLKEGRQGFVQRLFHLVCGWSRVAFSVVAHSRLLLFTRAHTDLIVGKSVMCRTEADDHIRDPNRISTWCVLSPSLRGNEVKVSCAASWMVMVSSIFPVSFWCVIPPWPDPPPPSGYSPSLI